MSENLKFRIIEKYESGGGAKLPIDYEDPKQVIHRPSINDVELVGNKTSEELGLVDASQIVSITERIDGHDSQIGNIETQIDDIETDVETAKADITQLKSDVSNHADAIASLSETVAENTTAIGAETTNRENADNQLQEQIDAIVSSSDVRDIVGTYAELLAYDTSSLGDEDIIKVLNDNTHENAMSYYRWDATTKEWAYVGSEGPYYTKSESDSRYVPVTRTVNGKALSTNIELNATDVGAQEVLVSGTNIKTINGQSLLEGGNIDIQGGSGVFIATYGTTTLAEIKQALSDNKQIIVVWSNHKYIVSAYIVQNAIVELACVNWIGYMLTITNFQVNNSWQNVQYQYPERNEVNTMIDDSVTINKIKIGNAELPIIDKAVTIPNYIYAITRTQYSLQAHNVNGVHDNSLTISKVSGTDRLKFLAWDNTQQEVVFDIDVPNANELGDLSLLTTDDKTSLVNALNEVYEKSGEPFRVKQWGSSWADGITIPVITKDISNTQIPKMVFSIDAEEGASYQIVGMIAYEVFDAVSGGNRVNVFPVCQFTGNGQKELSVRFMCAGTQDKVAKRINAWVLLKHR